MARRQVEAAVSECLAAGKEYVVWGSSLGWLVFYGALSRGLRSVGYELLPGLVAFAEQLAAEHQVRRGPHGASWTHGAACRVWYRCPYCSRPGQR